MLQTRIEQVVEGLERIGIVPVIKLEDTSKATALANALKNGGINCAEVTFRAAGADKVIRDMVKANPDMIVGAGTVLTIEQADRAIDAGAKFLVAPGLNPKVVKHVLDCGVPFIPGVSSSSEVEQALELGLRYVKFFPAEQAGGIEYIKAISAPYSDVRFMPTGGVNESNVLNYLASEKVFACGGSYMVGADLIKDGKWDEITRLCKLTIDKLLGFELAHVGINCLDEGAALDVADSFSSAFGFEQKNGNSSIFVSSGIEVMKSKYLGTFGHIAIKTNSILRAVHNLGLKGFVVDESTQKFNDKKKLVAVYLKGEIGGFGVHLLQK